MKGQTTKEKLPLFKKKKERKKEKKHIRMDKALMHL